ncbi:hypothetical protein AGMMS49938_18070 [Fibrobacterales bacterium]|nr:hypothetical protein AGMMS49938_18070 [Fibrobacterales bacterium]
MSTDKNPILDCESEEFEEAYRIALAKAEARRKRGNPNASKKATIEGYRRAIERIGPALADATKKALKEGGWDE